jgi:hypothetical protein
VEKVAEPAAPAGGDGDGPAAVYRRRREARLAGAARQERKADRIGQGRIAVVLAAAVLAWLAFGVGRVAAYWLAVPAVAFVALAVWHQRVLFRQRRAERAARYYERGLERLADRWAGHGEPGDRHLDPDHPYAADLDVFGPGSLFERLSTARTRRGEDRLAAWLLAPADAGEVRARQEAVADLRPRLDLREDVALLGGELPGGVDFDWLERWASAPPVLTGRRLRRVLPWLAALNMATLAAWPFVAVGSLPFAVAALVSGAVGLRLRARVQAVVAPVEKAEKALALLAGLLARLEREPFASPRLTHLRADLEAAGRPPSRRIAQLGTLVELLDSRRNQLFAPIAPLLFWTSQLAFAVEDWRRLSGPAVGRWLAAVAEIEALGSLAAFAYENPRDPFPEVVAEGPLYSGVGLGHPLLPADRSVRNDVELGGPTRLLIVSGSNMSGKSTLLRTVGVNAVLALAGAPVRAERLRLSPLALGATLRVQDSLQAGRSRFFAEITRVRKLMDLAAGPVPLLFLLDELFSGTNSHDRRIGAEAVVRRLLDAGAVGLVTTHDLALTELAERLGGRAANVHFADRFVGGEMTFDYRMRPGVVPHSNALALMRAVGLGV